MLKKEQWCSLFTIYTVISMVVLCKKNNLALFKRNYHWFNNGLIQRCFNTNKNVLLTVFVWTTNCLTAHCKKDYVVLTVKNCQTWKENDR